MTGRMNIWVLAGLATALLLGRGPDPLFSVAAADDIEKKLNNRIYVGEESDVQAVLDQASGFEATGHYPNALTEYKRLIARCDRWLHNPPGGQEPRMLMIRWMNWESVAETDTGEPEDYYGQTYIPLREYCMQKISLLPPRVRESYRDEIAVAADAMLATARATRDRAMVQRIADDYWLAPAGIAAMDLAAQLAFESGDFQTAIYFWERMWKLDAASFAAEPLRAVKLAAAYRVTDDSVGYAEILDEVKRKFDGFSTTLGRERFANLRVLLESDRLPEFFFGQSPWMEPRGLSQIGGNSQHTKPAPSFSRLGEVAATLDLTGYFDDSTNGNNMARQRAMAMFPGASVEDTRNRYNLFPVALGNRLVVQGPVRGHIWEIGTDDTGGDRRFPFSVEQYIAAPRGGVARIIRGGIEGETYAPVLYREHLYSVFHPGNIASRRATVQGDVLACYSLRDNGAVSWVTPSNEPDDPNADHLEFLSKMSFTPAVAAGSGLIFAGGNFMAGREVRYFMMAFRADTGKLVWSRKIASRLVETMQGGPFQMSSPEMAPPTYDNGILYFETNTGAIAALDGLTGTIRWIFKYRRPENADPDMMDSMRRGVQTQISHWANNPPIAHRGVGYFAPRDSAQLVAIHGRTGEFFRTYPESDDTASDPEYLLGVSNGVLHIQGRQQIYGLDLNFDHQTMLTPPPAGGMREDEHAYKTVPYSPNPADVADPEFIVGRGILTQDAVIVPTLRGLVRYDARTGKREVEGFMPWPADLPRESLGHCFVIAVPDGVSAPDSPNIYPTDHLPADADAQLPGEAGGPVAVKKRLFLVITNSTRITLIAVE